MNPFLAKIKRLHDQALAICDAAEKSKRDLNEAEQSDIACLRAEIADLKAKSGQWEASHRRQTSHVPPRPRSDPAAPATDAQRSLAIQAWLRANSSREWELTAEHRAACLATGIRPQQRELHIRLLPGDRLSQLQSAFAGSLPSQAALQARRTIESLALSSIVGTTGGTIVAPETMMASLEVNMLAYGGILQAAEIMRTPGRERLRWPTVNDTGNQGRRLGENAAVTTTAQPTFSAVYWDAYKYTSDEILVPYELLAGTPFNLPAVLGEMMGERIGRKLATDFTTGQGNNGPKGLIPAATSYSAPSATAIAWDDLESLIGAVDPAYRIGAAFMFHDATRQYLKKLKDGQGRPLWQDGPNGEEPATIKGYPWFVNQAMDSTIASGKNSVAFGQLSKYKVREVDAIRLYRLQELHRTNDQDGFLAFLEADGNLLDAGTAPVKYLAH